MAYRPRRRGVKPRRKAARQYGMLRRMKYGRAGRTGLAKSVHWFKEMAQTHSLTGSTGNSTGQMTFALSDLQNIPSIQNLFDLYKITGVKVKIIPRFNVSDVNAPLNVSGQMGTLPVLYIAPNRDPYVPAPTGIGDILNDDGCKVIRLTKPVNLFLKSPKALITLPGGTPSLPLQFNVGSKWQPWLTTGGGGQTIDQSAVSHFGYRWVINNPSSVECVLDVYTTYYFCCKEQD